MSKCHWRRFLTCIFLFPSHLHFESYGAKQSVNTNYIAAIFVRYFLWNSRKIPFQSYTKLLPVITFVSQQVICLIRLILPFINLAFIFIHGSDYFPKATTAVYFVMTGRQIVSHCFVVAYFHLVLFHHAKFLQFINLVKDNNKWDNTHGPKIWNRRLYALFHYVVGVAWIPIWNFSRFASHPGIETLSRSLWNRQIHGIQNPSKLKDVSMWELIGGFVFIIARLENMTVGVCAVVLVYIIAVTIQTRAKQLIKHLTSAQQCSGIRDPNKMVINFRLSICKPI